MSGNLNSLNPDGPYGNNSDYIELPGTVKLNKVQVTATSLYTPITPRPAQPLPTNFNNVDENGILDRDRFNSLEESENNYEEEYTLEPDADGNLEFRLPRYGYAQYINDMSAWQKQIREINGQIGWFYFKVYFNFKTDYGLLGSLLDDCDVPVKSVNTAVGFLKNCASQYSYSKIKDRITALYKFGNVLKHISLETPWFFKGISGLGEIPYPYTNDFQKERKINIICSEEAVDMRIGTLIDLYKYACFDTINCKELVPKNLRKFEMSIIIMHVPLKFHHEPTLYVDGKGQVETNPGKGLALDANDFSRLASFKMFTFQNCEIDLENFGTYYGDQLSNENPFSIGKNQIPIKYERVFEHRMNEWNEFLLGDDGFYYNNMPNYNSTGEDWSVLIQDMGDDSLHRIISNGISSNHETTKDYLISYSEYFLNRVWMTHMISSTGNSGKWRDMINSFKNQTQNMRNNIAEVRGAFNNLSDTWNAWRVENP